MEAFFYTVAFGVLVFVSGLAYRRPKRYRRIMTPLLFASLAGGLALLAYLAGVSVGIDHAAERTPGADPDFIWAVPPRWYVDPAWALGLFIVVPLYLAFLEALPSILGMDDEGNDKVD